MVMMAVAIGRPSAYEIVHGLVDAILYVGAERQNTGQRSFDLSAERNRLNDDMTEVIGGCAQR